MKLLPSPGWYVDLGTLGIMTFYSEKSAWKFINGQGLNGMDPYRRFLPPDARPIRRVED